MSLRALCEEGACTGALPKSKRSPPAGALEGLAGTAFYGIALPDDVGGAPNPVF